MSSLSIGKQLFLSLGALLSCTIALGCTAFFSLSNVAAHGGVASSSFLLIGLLLVAALVVGGFTFFIVNGINGILRSNVGEMRAAVVEISAAATQVASSSQSLAQGASEQAATIEETSSASAEINSMAQRNTENSRSTAELVTHSQAEFEQTNRSLTEMVEAMDGIISSSHKISKIIKVIDEIAFQTNILALNAAVEAARAGDAGMGFAVVADEVRNLAQRSAQAAKDTAELIEESIQRSHGGKEKVDQVAGNIRNVTGESAKIKILVDEINLGSVEQSRGIDQISRSITEMEKVTQSTAAGAEESAAAAEELGSQAKSLEDVTLRLHAMVNGTGIVGNVRSVSSTPRKVTRVAAPKPMSTVPRKARTPAFATPANSFPLDEDFQAF